MRLVRLTLPTQKLNLNLLEEYLSQSISTTGYSLCYNTGVFSFPVQLNSHSTHHSKFLYERPQVKVYTSFQTIFIRYLE